MNKNFFFVLSGLKKSLRSEKEGDCIAQEVNQDLLIQTLTQFLRKIYPIERRQSLQTLVINIFIDLIWNS